MDAALASALVSGGGVAGVFCILFVVSAIYPKSVVQDKDKIISELSRRNEVLSNQVAEGTAALGAAKDVISSLQQGMIYSGRFPPTAWLPGSVSVMPTELPSANGPPKSIPPVPEGGHGEPPLG